MRTLEYYRPLLSAVIMVVLTGCVTTPKQDFPTIATQSSDQFEQWQTATIEGVTVTNLTDLIAAPELKLLVDQALKANPSLQQTALTLAIAQKNLTVTSSDSKPKVSAGLDADVDEDGDSFSSDLTVSWELDIWQKLKNSQQASALDIEESKADYQAARDTLAANVMRSWLAIAMRQQLIDIEEQRLVLYQNNESIILQRYRTGLGDLEELDDAKSSSASSQATLAQYKQNLRTEQRTLKLLLGEATHLDNLTTVSEFPDVLVPLASLPKQDLAQRPDLRQAYAAIAASQYRTKVAYKNLLPSLDLSGSLTMSGDTLQDALFTSPVWRLLGSLSAPIFYSGSLKSQAEIAELTTEKLYWSYQETLLTAVSEVEEAIDQEISLALQQEFLSQSLTSAERSATNYEEKYRQGLVDIFELLSAQQQDFNQKVSLIQTTYNRLINRITLGLALGLGVPS